MKLPNRVRLPGRTVRVRLTVLYALLFLVSGALLLAIASGITVNSSAHVSSPRFSGGPPLRAGQASAHIHMLQSQVAALQSQVAALQSQVASQPGQHQLSHVLFMASLIALAIMTIVSAALGWVIAGRALRPVSQMTAAAQRISEDNLHERLAVAGPRDELKELGDTIDGLLARLEGAFAAQRRFVANASHELRTPLTTMRASLDVALAKPEPPPPQTVALAARLRAELDRVDALLEAFLVLAQAQHRHLPGYVTLPLDYVVAAALTGQTAAIQARNLTVQDTSGPGGGWVTGSQALLSRLVENVIGNAVCHNADGGWIRITTQTDGRWVKLVVENGGQVLDQRQVDELAQPFRRLGADRTGSDNGSGLGLSIVAAIVEAHGGTLDLQARDGGGLRVCVELPSAVRSSAAEAGVPG
ncbi:MAG TPA: HAMP domain-containing sensor histidine kinase [Streptosporangiaceae bacterium]|nr:HAMP domain-containing sensor histidine kinase [Streptosporangiaceae bacterium]